MCSGRDWEAAEKACTQSDFPGRRPVLHQQETEGRMAEPLEDGGGRESGLSLCEFRINDTQRLFPSFFLHNQIAVVSRTHVSQTLISLQCES